MLVDRATLGRHLRFSLPIGGAPILWLRHSCMTRTTLARDYVGKTYNKRLDPETVLWNMYEDYDILSQYCVDLGRGMHHVCICHSPAPGAAQQLVLGPYGSAKSSIGALIVVAAPNITVVRAGAQVVGDLQTVLT